MVSVPSFQSITKAPGFLLTMSFNLQTCMRREEAGT